MRCFSGALADSKPEREAWPGAAPGTNRAAVRLPLPALGNQVQIVPTLPFYISLPKALQQVETQPQRVLI